MRIEAFLRQSPIFQASRIARRMEVSLNAILRDEELTFFEALMLAAIFFEKKGGIKPSGLAETFQTTRGNVSHCISSLEAKGLVRRRIDPDDAWAFQLVLQPAGRRRAARVVGIGRRGGPVSVARICRVGDEGLTPICTDDTDQDKLEADKTGRITVRSA